MSICLSVYLFIANSSKRCTLQAQYFGPATMGRMLGVCFVQGGIAGLLIDPAVETLILYYIVLYIILNIILSYKSPNITPLPIPPPS